MTDNPYQPIAAGLPELSSDLPSANWTAARRIVGSVLAGASFLFVALEAHYTEYSPHILIDLLSLWVCVVLPVAFSIVRWGLRGFLVAILLSPVSFYVSILVMFVVTAGLGYDVMPVPN
ncbi:hypothetical protein [Planctomycetes bacterium CA13]|uniref:hypothetical protein n=1 Tax=Novipirellula herctigrandis TaxID=2527986 RepID=UPI0011B3839A